MFLFASVRRRASHVTSSGLSFLPIKVTGRGNRSLSCCMADTLEFSLASVGLANSRRPREMGECSWADYIYPGGQTLWELGEGDRRTPAVPQSNLLIRALRGWCRPGRGQGSMRELGQL